MVTQKEFLNTMKKFGLKVVGFDSVLSVEGCARHPEMIDRARQAYFEGFKNLDPSYRARAEEQALFGQLAALKDRWHL